MTMEITTEAPFYQHDCTRCTFLGHHGADDLYFCEQVIGGPTVLARHSGDGPDYISGRGWNNPAIEKAERLAACRGLLKDVAGVWLRDDLTVYMLEKTGHYRTGKPVLQNRYYFQMSDTGSVPREELEALAQRLVDFLNADLVGKE